MKDVTFFEWLILPSSCLVERGIPAARVATSRFEETGHRRPLDPSWAATFGAWGGVTTPDELADLAGKPVERVRQYAKESGLRFANRNLRRTHAELAIGLWCGRSGPARESCRRFGVWPAERRILCAAAQILVDLTEGGIAPILRWDPRKLEVRFAQLNLAMRPPQEVLRRARHRGATSC